MGLWSLVKTHTNCFYSGRLEIDFTGQQLTLLNKMDDNYGNNIGNILYENGLPMILGV